MSTIVTRAGKGSPLTHTEVDANFTNLNTDKLEVGASFNAAVAATPAVTANTAKVTNATHTGDVTGATALTIANDAVTNAKAADMAANTIKGNFTGSSGDPQDGAIPTNSLVGRAGGNITVMALSANQLAGRGSTGDIAPITLASTLSMSGTALGVADDAVTNAKLANVAANTIKGRVTAGTGDPEDLTGTQATTLLDTFTSALKGLAPASGGGTSNFLRADGTWAVPGSSMIQSIIIAASDETTPLTTGNGKVTFRMPYAFTLTAVRASLTAAQASGSIFTADINENGVSILSTPLTIDNTEKTSTTAATPAVISDTALADDAEITIDIDQVGSGSAAGLKVALIGYKT